MIDNNWCCKKMAAEIRIQGQAPTPFLYNPWLREYSIVIPKTNSVFCITFCPMCGTKLPSSLRDPWYDIMEQELKLDPNDQEDKKRIPQDFLTDEWWKKRGL